MMSDLILASGSAIRAKLLSRAGYDLRICPADIDEEALKETHRSQRSLDALAMILAEAKALAVSEQNPQALVIGADQILSCDGSILSKAPDSSGAAKQLAMLAGHRHDLISAVAIVRGGVVLAKVSDQAGMIMRPLSAAQIATYLDRVGDGVLSSVGCYQIEEFGIQLFDRIEGDLFTVMGLPLNKLCAALHGLGLDPLSDHGTGSKGETA